MVGFQDILIGVAHWPRVRFCKNMDAEMSSSRSGLQTKQTVALQRIYTLHFTQTVVHTLHFKQTVLHTLHFTRTVALQRIFPFSAHSDFLPARVMRIMMR